MKGREVKIADIHANSRADVEAMSRSPENAHGNKNKSSKKRRGLRKALAKLNCFACGMRGVDDEGTQVSTRASRKLSALELSAINVPVSMLDATDSECFYSAKSMFSDGGFLDNGLGESFLQMQVLNAKAPAAVPPGSVSSWAPLAMTLGEYQQAADKTDQILGIFEKDKVLSCADPGPADRMVRIPFYVQRIKNRVKEILIVDRELDMLLVFKLNLPGMPHMVEKFPKDGSVATIKTRRDYRSGKSYGQAFVLPDKRHIIRVWNVGAEPQIMWEDVVTMGENDELRIDHFAYTLDGSKSAQQWSIGKLHRKELRI